jgi:prepilin peptidase CpaA
MLATTLAIGIGALLLLGAWNDIATRLIPDAIPLAIAGLAILLRLPAGLLPTLYSVLVAGLVFTALLGLAIRGWLGGGDVKLAAALALALPPYAVWDFVTATTFCGGVLALPYIAVARFQPAVAQAAQPRSRAGLLTRISRAEARRLRQGGPLPYAVAIAAGGIITLHAMIG